MFTIKSALSLNGGQFSTGRFRFAASAPPSPFERPATAITTPGSMEPLYSCAKLTISSPFLCADMTRKSVMMPYRSI